MLFASAMRIRLHGMRPAGEPARGAAHALAEGTVEDGASDAWTAARSGDREALIEAVRDLGDDPAAIRRLIRQEPGSLTVVSDVLGDDFSELVAAALTEPFRQQPWRHDLQAIAARSELDTVGTDTPRSVDFALARAEVLRQGGRPHPARRLAEAVLATEQESGVEAHLILARLSASLDPDDARAHVEAYVAASDSPELARARTRRDPTLARLSP